MRFYLSFVFLLLGIATSYGQHSCTVVQQNDGQKKPCKFPFKIGGDRIYYGCTNFLETDTTKFWCSTATDENHNHIEGNSYFGYCTEDTCDIDDGTNWDIIDNINALKTEELVERYQREEEDTGHNIQECTCEEWDLCKWSKDIRRQTNQMGNHPIRRKLSAYYEERVCSDGTVHCCQKGTTPPPTITTTTTTKQPTTPKPEDSDFDLDPRILNEPKHTNQDLGTWLPRGDQEECGFKTVYTSIVGGAECKLGDCPFLGLIGYTGGSFPGVTYQCGGSLINKWYYVTAAHCVGSRGDYTDAHPGKIVEIVFGEYDTTTDPDCNISECVAKKNTRKPAKIIPHPGYDGRTTSRHDIALIRLDQRVTLFDGESDKSTITPVCFPWRKNNIKGQLVPGNGLRVMGWGKTTNDDRINLDNIKEYGAAINIVQEVDVPFVDGEECKKVFRTVDPDQQICAGGKAGKDSCAGDSGGPLVARRSVDAPWYQVGVVSYGPSQCGLEGYTAVYTSIPAHLQWVLDNLEE